MILVKGMPVGDRTVEFRHLVDSTKVIDPVKRKPSKPISDKVHEICEHIMTEAKSIVIH